MDSFGIEFLYSFSRQKPTKEIQDDIQKTTDGFFQKSLAYSSYYIMLFVAYSMIKPDTMHLAGSVISNFIA